MLSSAQAPSSSRERHVTAHVPRQPRRAALTSHLLARLWRLPAALGVALAVRRERRLLMQLDERALKDLGLNGGEAHTEALRGFWDIPIDRLPR